MRIRHLLRVAAVVAFVQGIGHAALILRQSPTHGPAEVALVTAMQTQTFIFGGAPRTYWGFYIGYAMMAALTCGIEAMLFWRLARQPAPAPELVRVVASTFAAFNIAHALLATRYFFYVPVVFDALLAAVLVSTWRTAAPAPSATS